jgi:hypothetical protein
LSSQKPETAFILSLIGGALMLLGGLAMSSFWFSNGGSFFGGMMGGFNGRMGGFGNLLGLMEGYSLVGLVAGIVVLVGALMLNSRPTEHSTWGTIIVVFSVISLVGMGGFFIGAALGIAGGALALSWRPTQMMKE